MPFDIFISYSHRDNFLAQKEEYGWVDSFHIALRQYLTGKLGRDARIWRDATEMRGNYDLNQALSGNVEKSLIFLPILSPNYLNSKYCLEELNTFCSQADVFQGIETRIFPIVKSPIENPPSEIKGNLRKFAFFNSDDFGKPTIEIDPSFGEKSRNEFNQKIADLAREIAEFIESIEDDTPNQSNITDVKKEPSADSGEKVPIIYLAEPSLDLFDKYLEIKRDLEERKNQGKIKFEFLPRELPQESTQIAERTDEAEDYRQKVRKDIEQSRLTVHLIGKRPNNFPPESRQSYLHLETEAAALRDGQADFNRLVWIPRNLYTEEELEQVDNNRHKEFVKKIRETGVGNDGLMQDSFEDFKERIQDIFKPKETPPPPSPTDKPTIYVLSDQSDLDTVSKLEKKLSDQGCDIFSTRDFWGDPAMNEFHRQYLCNCDAVLIYWHTTHVPWVKIKAQELNKTKGYGRSCNFLGRGVFWEGNFAGRENYTFSADLQMVKGYECLSEFVSKVKSKKEALYQ